jgi:hypothetical protein
LIWVIYQVAWGPFIFIFLGFLVGSFFLDIDHLIFWLVVRPNLDESKLAQIAWKKWDFRSLIKLAETTHQHHTNLIFHHYFFQVIFTLISFYIFTSTSDIFTKSLVLAINLHLLVDEFIDFKRDPKHLQLWLFAREEKQLPINYLKYYLLLFLAINLVFIFILINSVL